MRYILVVGNPKVAEAIATALQYAAHPLTESRELEAELFRKAHMEPSGLRPGETRPVEPTFKAGELKPDPEPNSILRQLDHTIAIAERFDAAIQVLLSQKRQLSREIVSFELSPTKFRAGIAEQVVFHATKAAKRALEDVLAPI